jgi:hypothetical protein
MRAVALLLGIAACLGAVALANVVLLGYGSERSNRVGRLSPRAPALAPAPAPAVREHETGGGEDLDD